MRIRVFLAIGVLALAAACTSASPTMPTDVGTVNLNVGGTGSGGG
jgi:hypothetical protein